MGKDSINFFCQTCSFTDNEYDFGKALDCINKSSEKRTIAKCEQLLNVYSVKLAKIDPCIAESNHQTDEVASFVLSNYCPNVLNEATPKSVQGDGNCCYCAVSLALYNTESHHQHLRLLAAIEIATHKQYYDTADAQFIDMIDDINVVTSNTNLLQFVSTLGSYAYMQHLYGISAAVSEPIQSFFPPFGIGNSITKSFTRKVIGRGV